MDVSIIYVNYYTKELIIESIKSVIRHTENIQYEIIIVDNNTQDLSELKMKFKNVEVVQLSSNLGFGMANNKGSEIAKGKYLLFLNPDTIILNNAIYILFNALNKHQQYGIVGGNLFDENLKPMHSYMWVTLSFSYIFRKALMPKRFYASIKYQFNFSEKDKLVGYSTGADLMIRRSIFDEIKGFSDKIFMYYEDVDLCIKTKRLKYDVANIPQAHIQHLEGRSIQGGCEYEKQQKRLNMNIKSQIKVLYYTIGRSKSLWILNVAILLFTIKAIIYRIVNKKKCSFINNQKNFYLLLKKGFLEYEKSFNTRI